MGIPETTPNQSRRNSTTMRQKNLLLKSAKSSQKKKRDSTNKKQLLIFELPYHARGVQRKAVSRAFHNSGLAKLMQERHFIVAQCRPMNLRDRVCNTALENIPGANPSNYLTASHQESLITREFKFFFDFLIIFQKILLSIN